MRKVLKEVPVNESELEQLQLFFYKKEAMDNLDEIIAKKTEADGSKLNNLNKIHEKKKKQIKMEYSKLFSNVIDKYIGDLDRSTTKLQVDFIGSRLLFVEV